MDLGIAGKVVFPDLVFITRLGCEPWEQLAVWPARGRSLPQRPRLHPPGGLTALQT
jgi:hypothetical protein